MAKKLGRGVALVGAGMSKFGAFPGKTTRDLFVEAILDMRVAGRGVRPTQSAMKGAVCPWPSNRSLL